MLYAISYMLPNHPTSGPSDAGAPDAMVDLSSAAPGILVELRYATPHNLFGRAMYSCGRAFLRRAVADRLREAQRELERSGLRLKVWDAYRPLSVQRAMWVLFPDSRYVAPPDRGSSHNRGAAVDVTLVDSGGRELPMGTDYDDFTERAHPGYPGLPAEERRNRETLQRAMTRAGFRPLDTEWWHFSDPDAARYPLDDTPIHALAEAAPTRRTAPGGG